MLSLTSVSISGWFFVLYCRERLYMKRVLIGIINSPRIKTRDHLVSIKRFLNKHIHYDTSRKNEARPLLRASATETLNSNYGFCGENARVAIHLLHAGGVRANRLYLEARTSAHVAVEHFWEGHWFYFDGHNDPEVMLCDQKVATIAATQINEFPNMFRDRDPWIVSYRVRLCFKTSLFHSFCDIRLPMWFILFTESPALMKSMLFAMLAIGAFITGQLIV